MNSPPVKTVGLDKTAMAANYWCFELPTRQIRLSMAATIPSFCTVKRASSFFTLPRYHRPYLLSAVDFADTDDKTRHPIRVMTRADMVYSTPYPQVKGCDKNPL